MHVDESRTSSRRGLQRSMLAALMLGAGCGAPVEESQQERSEAQPAPAVEAAPVASASVAGVSLPPRTPQGTKTCAGFAVTVGGRTYRGDTRVDIPASQVGATLQVRGTHVEFDVVASTFEVLGYTLTGAPAQIPLTNVRTRIFDSKRPDHSDVLNDRLRLRLQAEQLVLEREGRRQDMKIQSKDCNQGGIFQMEPEPAVVEVNTLAAGFQFFLQDPVSGRLFFTNGTTILGYDSPQEAVLLSNTPTQSRWRVEDGGRIGMVIGEDAFEALDEVP